MWFILSAKVEQKARREDVLNQLLLLLNTAIHRKQKESRGSSARSSRRGSKKRSSSKMEIVLMQSTEEQEDEEEDKDGETNYMSGALGLIPTDWKCIFCKVLYVSVFNTQSFCKTKSNHLQFVRSIESWKALQLKMLINSADWMFIILHYLHHKSA